MEREVVRSVLFNNYPGITVGVAAVLAWLARHFQSHIEIEHNGAAADAASPLGLIALQVHSGNTISIRAKGPDAEDAVEAMCGLLPFLPDVAANPDATPAYLAQYAAMA